MIHYSPRIPLLVVPLFCFLVSYGQEKGDAHITTWFHNKPGAVSISFDDGGYTQYTAAYPILEKYSLKVTFGIVGEWTKEEAEMSAEPDQFEIKKMGWQQLLDLLDHGHEIAAHGYRHERYDKFSPVDSLVRQMILVKSLIESKTNHPVVTIHYPYSFASGNIPVAARKAGFLFGRTGLDTVNSVTPQDMYLLATQTILNSSEPDSAIFGNWLEFAEGKWLILMYHNLFSEDSREMSLNRYHHVLYSYSLPPESFEMQVKRIVEKDYWIAPISTVGKYIIERDSTVLRTIRVKDEIIIVASTNLDTRLYDQLLTLELEVPWSRVKVEGSLQDGICEPFNNKLFIDFFPECVIILSKAN
jgi:peptidoglycan/xylan/chitin deacetylase (PgdA/CDA1 family)